MQLVAFLSIPLRNLNGQKAIDPFRKDVFIVGTSSASLCTLFYWPFQDLRGELTVLYPSKPIYMLNYTTFAWKWLIMFGRTLLFSFRIWLRPGESLHWAQLYFVSTSNRRLVHYKCCELSPIVWIFFSYNSSCSCIHTEPKRLIR